MFATLVTAARVDGSNWKDVHLPFCCPSIMLPLMSVKFFLFILYRWSQIYVVLWSMLAMICGWKSMLLHLLRMGGLVLCLKLFLNTRFSSLFLCLHV